MSQILFDKPINNLSEDFLDRKQFSIKIADTLIYPNKEPLVVGLCGSWGSGKTSVINMIIDTIKHKTPSNNILIMRFNPWIISNQKQLITQFFQQLSLVIGNNKTEHTQKIAKEILRYALDFLPDILSVTQSVVGIPIPDLLISFFSKINKIRLNIGKKSKHNSTIFEQKIYINDLLKQLDRKIIVFIDDIDRLNDEETQQIFQLVKSIADFNNIVYFLAFDKNIVLQSLKNVQEGNGEEYLEKIVQIPILLPSFDRQNISKYLFSKIAVIMNEKSFNDNAFVDMFYSGMYFYFQTLRDVNRYLNILQFNLAVLYEETNFEDLCAIMAVQVFNSNLYNKIASNLDVFTGLINNSAYNFQSLKDRCEKILEKFSSNYEKKMLMKMFPKLKAYYKNTFFSEEQLNIYRQNKHICSPNIADRYFVLHVKDTDITQEEFENIVQSMSNAIQFARKVNDCFNHGKFSSLLILFIDHIDEYDTRYYLIILKTLYMVKFCKGFEFRKFEFSHIFYQLCFITIKLLNKISKDESFSILFSIVSSEDTFLEQCIYTIMQVDKRQNEDVENGLVLTDQALERISNVIIKRIQKLAATKEIFDNHDTIDLLRYWKMWDVTNSIDEYLKSIMDDPSKILLLLSSALHVTTISRLDTVIQEEKLELDLNELSQIIVVQDIKKKVEEIYNASDFIHQPKNCQIAVTDYLNKIKNFNNNKN